MKDGIDTSKMVGVVASLEEVVEFGIQRLLYQCQELLDIKDGDTCLDTDAAVKNILEILNDQYRSRYN